MPYFFYGIVFQYNNLMYNTVSPTLNYISAQVILSTILASKDLRGWQLFYDKYAAIMFGCICTLTDDNETAEKILLEAIVQLKEKEILPTFGHAFLPCLLKYTNDFAIQQLIKQGIKRRENIFGDTKLLYLICTRCHLLKEAAAILNITEEEAKKRLQLEFLAMRIEIRREKYNTSLTHKNR